MLGVFNLVFLCFGALMASVTRPKRALWWVLVVSLPRWAATGLAGVTGVHWLTGAAGGLGILVALVSAYAAFALLLEDVRSEEVLPIGRTGPAGTPSRATSGCSCATWNARRVYVARSSRAQSGPVPRGAGPRPATPGETSRTPPGTTG
ncbi:hypothetical protein SSPIM334S_00857 [Streptomyces spiroverticillatus]